jgi:splicing factor 1
LRRLTHGKSGALSAMADMQDADTDAAGAAPPLPASDAPKKKSRWGGSAVEAVDAAAGVPGKKKSRWGGTAEPDVAAAAALPAADPREVALLQTRLTDISKRLMDPGLEDDRPAGERSPSPDPEYDDRGRRTNTRAVRYRLKLQRQRQEVVDKLVKLDPKFAIFNVKAPVLGADGRPDRHPYKHKVMMPTDNPEYNYKGVVIGPRGINQKRLEQELACRISVRGKGSSKNLQKDGQGPLHVLIEADSQEKLDRAIPEVEKLMIPVSAEEKARQLREVAIINGTYRDEACASAGSRGIGCQSARSGT